MWQVRYVCQRAVRGPAGRHSSTAIAGVYRCIRTCLASVLHLLLPAGDVTVIDCLPPRPARLRMLAYRGLWRAMFVIVCLAAGYPLEALNADESFEQAALSENLGADAAPSRERAVPDTPVRGPTMPPAGMPPVTCWPSSQVRRGSGVGTTLLRAVTRFRALAHTILPNDTPCGDPA